MKSHSRTRCVLVCAAFIGLFSIFSFRLIYLQAIKHDEYAGLAAEKHVYKQIIHAERGTILDAKIVPPTSQNQKRIEQDLHALVQQHLELSNENLTWKCEQAIRNYDPCISCATHFLDMSVERA